MIPDWITAVTALIALLLSLFNTYTLVRREMRLGLIAPRLEAYRKLWKHMDLAAPSRCLEDPAKDIDDESNDVKQTLTKEDLETIDCDLRSWYYQEGDGGNGIFLSNKSSKIYRTALKAVLDASEDDKESTKAVVTCLSDLRSRTKKDITVYGRWEE